MQTRPSVDFHHVERRHAEIHGRLENWARWCDGTAGDSASPMFRLYRPDNFERTPVSAITVIDGIDASKIAKGVAILPTLHRMAIQWCYITPYSPRKACQKIGTSPEGLAQYISDGRQMLINRRV